MYDPKVVDVCQCPQRAYFHFYGSLSEPLILLNVINLKAEDIYS